MFENRVFLHKSVIEKKGDYILYRMQQSQRIEYNHSLVKAIELANKDNLPLVVSFAFTSFPEANKRHYFFMYQGLKTLSAKLKDMGVNVLFEIADPVKHTLKIASKAKTLIMDCGYLKIQRQWLKEIISNVDCEVYVFESDIVVPVYSAYSKEAWSAAVLRPKINVKLSGYLEEVYIPALKNKTQIFDFTFPDRDTVCRDLCLDDSVDDVSGFFSGGEEQACNFLTDFIENKLCHYGEKRNFPEYNFSSELSPYLHFGQISPIKIAIEILKRLDYDDENVKAFLEELIVRRELAINFVFYNKDYDNYKCLPEWAKIALENHKNDYRETIYSLQSLENANTHDNAWNAAQKEMLITGKMHNYMRMYWGKKILEWSETPEEAFNNTIYLNNKYCLDGRDANSFAGIAWCYGKHDRAWRERSIFGTVRYMNYAGLSRKYDIEKYIRKFS